MTQTGDRRPIAARGLPPVIWLADQMIRAKWSPNGISVAGMIAALLAGLAFGLVPQAPHVAWALWLIGALLVQLRLMANMMDGMVAVGRGIASPVGELYNEVPDRVSDTAILIGFSVGLGAGWSWGLAAALAAMATAYVRAVGKAAGGPSDFRGPMDKQQRMAVVTAVAVIYAISPWDFGADVPVALMALLVALSTLTAIRRLLHVAAALHGGRR